jgi:tetratricopeptide (TPR) repeat protein
VQNPGTLQQELDDIERQLASSPPRAQSLLLKQAGDLCSAAGERRRALGWYGRAVNLHLELGEAPRAAALCHMILNVQPEAVRARCTLAWLALAGGRVLETRELVEQYTDSARKSGQNAMATQQLAWMHEATDDVLLRRDLVRAVRSLGDEERAAALAAARPPAPLDYPELWARVLHGTLAPPPTP